MKTHHLAIVVLECLVLLVALIFAGDWITSTFFYRYTPSPEHESAFLRDYSPRSVIKYFAFPYSVEIGTGVSSSAGRKFVTNERIVDPTFTIQADLRPSFMTAMSEDLTAQLIRAGATIVANRVGPQGERQLFYRDGTSAGSVVSYPLLDGQNAFSSAGTQKVRAHIVITEKCFPRENDAIQASSAEY